MPELLAKNFVYPSRPAASFEQRWKNIDDLLVAEFGRDRRPFSLLDLGSGTGYFSLQVAKNFAKSQVVAVEGAIGVGNDPAVSAIAETAIAKSPGVVATTEQIAKLKLKNCRVAPEVWTAEDIGEKAE